MIEFFPSRTVALEILGLRIHWYGIMYVLAAFLAIVLLPRMQRYRELRFSRDEWISLVSWVFLGAVVGGRLGYAFFYEPRYFLEHPLEILAVWRGGMASHGGFIGAVIVLGIVARLWRADVLRIADVAVIPVALGLALGRLGNFINLELYGTVTTLPWGIAIPGIEGLRHPTQLYAFAKDLFVAAACLAHVRRRMIPGETVVLFLVLYAVLRFGVEFLREQQHPLIDVGIPLSRGQILTVPLFVAGVAVWWLAWWRRPKTGVGGDR